MSSRWQQIVRLAGHLCRLGLAWIFLLAGILKALDPEGLAQEIAQYGILPAALNRPLAYSLIPLEVAVGAALLLNFRPVWSFSVAAGLMAMFIGAIGYAIVTDQPLTECGCFGRNTPRTPLQTLVEDLGFLAAALVGLMSVRGSGSRSEARLRGWKGPALAATVLVSGAFVFASPHLPIDDLATALKPGVRWKDLNVALAEADLGKDRYLVAILGMRDPATADALPDLNKLAASSRFPMIGLYADDDAAYNEFFWTRGPAFPLYQATASDLRRLHRRLPRFFAVKEGLIKATWEMPPTEEQVAEVLG